MDDNGDSGTRGRDMSGVCAVDRRQPAEHVPIADHDEFPRLAIAGAARPSGDVEDIAQHLVWQRVWSKLANGPQIPEQGEHVRG